MEKKFNTLKELLEDEVFINNFKNNISKLIHQRKTRPEPEPGYYYRRDWYDRLEFEPDYNFFFSQAILCMNKSSDLSREIRSVVMHVFNKSVYDTQIYYNTTEANLPTVEIDGVNA